MLIEKYMFECIYIHTRKIKDYNEVKKENFYCNILIHFISESWYFKFCLKHFCNESILDMNNGDLCSWTNYLLVKALI